MAKLISAKSLLSKLTPKDRILLVNPPVEETRYSWIRWNQPLDLLKLAAHLREEVGCAVELLDLMKPDREGVVPEEFLPPDRRYRQRGGQRYPMRRYGLPYATIRKWAYDRRAAGPKEMPTQVWVTSLCWYWFGSVGEMCRVAREALPDAQVVAIGNYPRVVPDHAKENCLAHAAVTGTFGLPERPALFELYGNQLPPFLALKLADPQVAVKEVTWGVGKRILDYSFFEEDVCREGGERLMQVIRETAGLHKHLRFHLLCGLYPEHVTPALARLLVGRNIAALNFEEADVRDRLDVGVYVQARRYLAEAGLKFPDSRLSGFVWIGRPRDELDPLIERSFQVLDTFGSIILKPYAPIPNSPEHQRYRAYLEKLPLADWSPHFFPMAEANGITCAEYHDLYRMAAFLNEKVRSRAFDFLQGTLGAELLKSSLQREVWNLGPSPLRVINQPPGV